MKRPPLNPTEAKACCKCRHWKPLSGILSKTGECRESRWGVTYKLKDGSEKYVEYWTTGAYATCAKWEEATPEHPQPNGGQEK